MPTIANKDFQWFAPGHRWTNAENVKNPDNVHWA
jgi:hypothetical protein